MRKNRFNILTSEEFDNDVVEGEGKIEEVKEEKKLTPELLPVVEDACEAIEETEDAIEINENLIENSPTKITDEDVAVAQETLYLHLGKLGYKDEHIKQFRFSFESNSTNLEKLTIINDKLKLAKEDYLKKLITLANSNLGISIEYNAVDWPNFFLGWINTLWRGVANGSKTKINNPSALVTVLTGGWTTAAQLYKLFTRIVGTVLLNLPSLADLIKEAIDNIRGKGAQPNINININGDINVYQSVIANYKKASAMNYEQYVANFKAFKELIKEIKKYACTPCELRSMSTTEIKGIKLFKPDKATREIKQAIDYYKTSDKKMAKLAEDIASFVGKEIIEFIAKNTIRDV